MEAKLEISGFHNYNAERQRVASMIQWDLEK